MAELRQSLKDAVKKLAFRASLDSLRQKGVQEVNVVGLDRISNLIEEAVFQSLRHRMLGVETAEIAESARANFVKLLRSGDPAPTKQQLQQQMQDQAQEDAANLREEISRQDQLLQERMDLAGAELERELSKRDGFVQAALEQLFTDFRTEGVAGLDAAEPRVIATTLTLTREERAIAARLAASQKSREAENLERRVSKLKKSLETTERRLAEVAKLKKLDDGLASVYREVQGLESDADQFEQKRDLMLDIFQANLALQKGAS